MAKNRQEKKNGGNTGAAKKRTPNNKHTEETMRMQMQMTWVVKHIIAK